MPDAFDRQLDRIIGRGLLSGTAIVAELRAKLLKRLVGRLSASIGELTRIAREIIKEYEPSIAANLYDSEIAAWVVGVAKVANRLPLPAVRQLDFLGGGKPPFSASDVLWGDDGPFLRFPAIELAAQRLADRRIVTRPMFDALSNEAKGQAFTVAGDITTETIGAIRDKLGELLIEGPSLKRFRDKTAEILDVSWLGDWHQETVYRTNLQTAYSQGHDELAQNEIVQEVFPYQEYLPIHDGRCRPEHLALGSLGLSGTGVYRTADPFWDVFTPPWDYNCILPGTEIQGRVELVLRSFYSGEAVEIELAGNRLRVTVNHPVLTPAGFVAAGTLKKGDNVLNYCVEQYGRGRANHAVSCADALNAAGDTWRASPQFEIQHRPAEIQQIFTALTVKREFVRMRIGPHDLHGDARNGKGYVDIVRASRKLWTSEMSATDQFSQQFPLPFSNSATGTLVAGLRDCKLSFVASRRSPNGLPRPGALTRDATGHAANLLPLHFLGIGSAAHLDASIYKPSTNNSTINANLAAQLLDRSPGAVAVDQIAQVRRFFYSGHVFDAQCEGGWLVGNGIIISNCRCGVNLLTIEAAARAGVQEAQQWLRTGVKPPLVSRLPEIPFRPREGWASRPRLRAA